MSHNVQDFILSSPSYEKGKNKQPKIFTLGSFENGNIPATATKYYDSSKLQTTNYHRCSFTDLQHRESFIIEPILVIELYIRDYLQWNKHGHRFPPFLAELDNLEPI